MRVGGRYVGTLDVPALGYCHYLVEEDSGISLPQEMS